MNNRKDPIELIANIVIIWLLVPIFLFILKIFVLFCIAFGIYLAFN